MKNMSDETMKKISVIISIIILAVAIFAISYTITSNNLEEEYAVEENKEVDSQVASTSVGKNVSDSEKDNSNSARIDGGINDVRGSETVNEQDRVKNTEIETSAVQKVEKKKQEESSVTTEDANVEVEVDTVDPTFVAPVEGEIIRDFAMDSLVYSETLKEWVTHSGIDIRAEKATIVKSAADGTVKSIKNDPRYGLTVVIEHNNGYQSVYSNLLTTEFVKEGESVKQGQSIGTVGNTASFEIADPTHLHFEILKDGVAVNPGLYL